MYLYRLFSDLVSMIIATLVHFFERLSCDKQFRFKHAKVQGYSSFNSVTGGTSMDAYTQEVVNWLTEVRNWMQNILNWVQSVFGWVANIINAIGWALDVLGLGWITAIAAWITSAINWMQSWINDFNSWIQWLETNGAAAAGSDLNTFISDVEDATNWLGGALSWLEGVVGDIESAL